MIIVHCPRPPKGAIKTQNGRFRYKIELRLKEVWYKVSLCENCQQHSCIAFIGLTICAQIICGGRLLLPEISGQTDRFAAKSVIFDLIFARSASASLVLTELFFR